MVEVFSDSSGINKNSICKIAYVIKVNDEKDIEFYDYVDGKISEGELKALMAALQKVISMEICGEIIKFYSDSKSNIDMIIAITDIVKKYYENIFFMKYLINGNYASLENILNTEEFVKLKRYIKSINRKNVLADSVIKIYIELIEKNNEVVFEWVNRKQNKHADKLSKFFV